MPRSDQQLLAEIRAAMARLGQRADDRTDDHLRSTERALVGDRPDALDVILRALMVREGSKTAASAARRATTRQG
jgi:hypothetical protein